MTVDDNNKQYDFLDENRDYDSYLNEKYFKGLDLPNPATAIVPWQKKQLLVLSYVRKLYCNGCYRFDVKIGDDIHTLKNQKVQHLYLRKVYFDFKSIFEGEDLLKELKRISTRYWKDMYIVYDDLIKGYVLNYEYSNMEDENSISFRVENVQIEWATKNKQTYKMKLAGNEIVEMFGTSFNKILVRLNQPKKAAVIFGNFDIKVHKQYLQHQIPAECYDSMNVVHYLELFEPDGVSHTTEGPEDSILLESEMNINNLVINPLESSSNKRKLEEENHSNKKVKPNV